MGYYSYGVAAEELFKKIGGNEGRTAKQYK